MRRVEPIWQEKKTKRKEKKRKEKKEKGYAHNDDRRVRGSNPLKPLAKSQMRPS
jgi:hypothetical protein